MHIDPKKRVLKTIKFLLYQNVGLSCKFFFMRVVNQSHPPAFAILLAVL